MRRAIAHMPCGHRLHAACLEAQIGAFTGDSWSRCPLCRAEHIAAIRKNPRFAQAAAAGILRSIGARAEVEVEVEEVEVEEAEDA